MCVLCSVVIIYSLVCDAQTVTREGGRAAGSVPSSLVLDPRTSRGNKSLSEGAKTFEMADSCHHACTWVCVLATFRSVFKLNIVCVLSANALECISLEIFLRNNVAPVRAKFPY